MNKDIRQDKNIMGLKLKKEMYKFRAFVDGLVLFLLDPWKGIEFLIEKLNGFGLLAGVNINNKKRDPGEVLNIQDKKDLMKKTWL